MPCLVDPTLHTNPKGYSRYSWTSSSGKHYDFAHAALLAQALGRDILPGHHAAHKCNHPACWRVHPDHVYEATPSENERDKYRPAPYAVYPVEWRILPRKRANPHAHLLPEIQALLAQRWNARQIAERLGVPLNTCRDLVRRQRKEQDHA